MLLQNLRARIGARLNGDSEAGFTLIELLVVMLILGILAAIAIPAFFNQKDKATDASVKAMARSAETALETWATDNGGKYVNTTATTGPSGAELHEIEPTIQAGMISVSATDNTYTITAQEEGSEQKFMISRSNEGTTSLTCEVKGKGGCPSDGNWGK